MRPLDTLSQSEHFTIYPDSSKLFAEFSDLHYELSMKNVKYHHNILVECYFNFNNLLNPKLFIFTQHGLIKAIYDHHNNPNEIFTRASQPVTFTKDFLNASYVLIGHWNGGIS